MVGFPTAKQWRYVTEILMSPRSREMSGQRNYWQPEQIHDFLKLIEDDPMLHLDVHIGFVCSLRAGEVAGIDTSLIDLKDKSLWIKRILQRVSDESLATLPREEIIHVFPKKKKTSKSSLILKAPGTEESYRKLYLTTPLVEEINSFEMRLQILRYLHIVSTRTRDCCSALLMDHLLNPNQSVTPLRMHSDGSR